MKEKFLDKDHYQTLLNLAKKRSNRDYVLFLLAGNLGLRVGEVVRLRKTDFYFKERFVNVPSLKKRKGGMIFKDTLPVVYIPLPLGKLLDNYIFTQFVRTSKDWLFIGIKKGTHLRENGAQRIFKRYMKEMHVDASFHSLRHYAGDSLYKATRDMKIVQATLRHSYMSSTSIYVHPGVKEIEESMEKRGFIE